MNFDGNLEIIASGGTPTETEIYVLDQHKELVMASINEALQALSVMVLADRTLEAYFKESQLTKEYQLQGHELMEVQLSVRAMKKGG